MSCALLRLRLPRDGSEQCRAEVASGQGTSPLHVRLSRNKSSRVRLNPLHVWLCMQKVV
jgi:hypothetical protein